MLALRTAESDIWPSTTVEVTSTTTPEPRSRNWDSTACVVAITPSVLISKTSRARAMRVPSNTLIDGTPALVTRTSNLLDRELTGPWPK